MQDAVIDGLFSNLVVNGVEVTSYVEAELGAGARRPGEDHGRRRAARTDDVLLGFDILDCRDRAEAIAVAAEHPLAARGVPEIRALG
jgi:predicted nucleic acid-binding protein